MYINTIRKKYHTTFDKLRVGSSHEILEHHHSPTYLVNLLELRIYGRKVRKYLLLFLPSVVGKVCFDIVVHSLCSRLTDHRNRIGFFPDCNHSNKSTI